MDISCSFAPSADTPAHIELAERLGFHRAWVYDSPAACADLWMTLAVAAHRTERIGLAPGAVADRPFDVPIVIAAEGPRGLEAARRVGDGVSASLMDPPVGFDWCVRVLLGTVLEENEFPTSARVVDVAGPAAALAYHGL